MKDYIEYEIRKINTVSYSPPMDIINNHIIEIFNYEEDIINSWFYIKKFKDFKENPYLYCVNSLNYKKEDLNDFILSFNKK